MSALPHRPVPQGWSWISRHIICSCDLLNRYHCSSNASVATRFPLPPFPFRWRSPADTYLELARFHPHVARPTTSPAAQQQPAATAAGVASASPPSSEGTSAPNVVLVHSSDGIEVLHLYTGRTVCRVARIPRGRGHLFPLRSLPPSDDYQFPLPFTASAGRARLPRQLNEGPPTNLPRCHGSHRFVHFRVGST